MTSEKRNIYFCFHKKKSAQKFQYYQLKILKTKEIVYAKDKKTIGVGAGQMSRIDSAKIAINKAKDNNLELKGSVMASDAFFPFVDGIETLVQAGVSAIIQPSGSIRDKEIIKFANQTGTILVFSNSRHFNH